MKKHLPKSRTIKATFDYESGPVKIKDGLFMGDEKSARDIDFLVSNKVTHIINTVVKKIPNLYQKYGIYYLSVHWTESQKNIFDKKNHSLIQIQHFIEQTQQMGQCVLVHSINGKSRASTVVIAYLMKKYSWSLSKAYQYVRKKKQPLEIRQNFYSQLKILEDRLSQDQNLSSDWYAVQNEHELLIKNTLINSKIQLDNNQFRPRKAKKRIQWMDKITTQSQRNVQKNILTSHTRYNKSNSNKKLKSILKEQYNDQPISPPSSEQINPYQNSNNRLKNNYQKMSKSQMVEQINGHVVNLTVNNYISVEKEDSRIRHNGSLKNTLRYNSIQERDRSDTKKNLKKKVQSKSGSRLMPYQNIISSFRSPYDTNFASKSGSNSKIKKQEQIQVKSYNNSIQTLDRPPSVGSKQIKKPKTYAELLAASSAKRKMQLGTNRERIFRYK